MSDSLQPSQALLGSLQRCNRTELYQLCRRAKLNIPSSSSRDELASYLTGYLHPPSDPNLIDTWRKGLRGFVLENWAVLQPQLTCPIRHDINACQKCVDMQVITCVVENKDYEALIQLHRKKE